MIEQSRGRCETQTVKGNGEVSGVMDCSARCTVFSVGVMVSSVLVLSGLQCNAVYGNVMCIVVIVLVPVFFVVVRVVSMWCCVLCVGVLSRCCWSTRTTKRR